MHRNKLVPPLKMSRLFSTQSSSVSGRFFHLLMQTPFAFMSNRFKRIKVDFYLDLVPCYISGLLLPDVLQKYFQECPWEPPPQKAFCDDMVKLFISDNRIHASSFGQEEFYRNGVTYWMWNAEMQPARMSSHILSVAHGILGSVSHTFTCTQIFWDLANTDSDSIGLGHGLSFYFPNKLLGDAIVGLWTTLSSGTPSESLLPHCCRLSRGTQDAKTGHHSFCLKFPKEPNTSPFSLPWGCLLSLPRFPSKTEVGLLSINEVKYYALAQRCLSNAVFRFPANVGRHPRKGLIWVLSEPICSIF